MSEVRPVFRTRRKGVPALCGDKCTSAYGTTIVLASVHASAVAADGAVVRPMEAGVVRFDMRRPIGSGLERISGEV